MELKENKLSIDFSEDSEFSMEKTHSQVFESNFMLPRKMREIAIATKGFEILEKENTFKFKKGDLFEILGNESEEKIDVRAYGSKTKFTISKENILKCNKSLFDKLGDRTGYQLVKKEIKLKKNLLSELNFFEHFAFYITNY